MSNLNSDNSIPMSQIETTEQNVIEPDTAGLRTRGVRGGTWVFALQITNRVFGLIRTIVLARLLALADFGSPFCR